MLKYLFLIFAIVVTSLPVFAESQVEVVQLRSQQELRVDGETVRSTSAEIVNEKLIQVSRSVAKIVTWSEKQRDKETHFYSINLRGKKWIDAKKTSYELLMKHGSFDPLQPQRNEIAAELQSRANCELYIIQFVTQNLKIYREALDNMGVKVYKFIPNHSFVVRMNSETAEKVGSLEFVRWVGKMPAAYKLEANLFSKARGITSFTIVAASKDVKAEAIAKVKELGGKVLNPTSGSTLFTAELSEKQVIEVAHIDSILWIEKETAIEVDMDNAYIQGGGEYINSGEFGEFKGEGLHLHVLEGINKSHPEFAANKYRKAPIPVGTDAYTSHGQQTFGQIFATGIDPKCRGMAPKAQGYFTPYNDVYSAEPGAPGSRYELVKRLIDEYGVMGQTASWGYSRVTSYTARSVEMDELIFDLDMPITQSQSNSGTTMSRPQAWAKNIISVGAAYHFDDSDDSNDKWSGSSWSKASIGPAEDGRIKPDVCGYYDKIYTTTKDGYTTGFGGTSGATPMVFGHLALLLEMWTKGTFGNKVTAEATPFENRPHFTTSKALLINSAKQYAFEGENHDLTRVHQGWGFPGLDNLMKNRDKMIIDNESTVLSELDSKTYTVNVAAGEAQLKATLTWNEPAAAVASAKQLINNLNLKVTAPDGTVYWGNNGLSVGNYSTPGGEANAIDNVENVFVANPAPGTWTVEVIADEINADNHLETADMDVDYALVVSGNTK